MNSTPTSYIQQYIGIHTGKNGWRKIDEGVCGSGDWRSTRTLCELPGRIYSDRYTTSHSVAWYDPFQRHIGPITPFCKLARHALTHSQADTCQPDLPSSLPRIVPHAARASWSCSRSAGVKLPHCCNRATAESIATSYRDSSSPAPFRTSYMVTPNPHKSHRVRGSSTFCTALGWLSEVMCWAAVHCITSGDMYALLARILSRRPPDASPTCPLQGILMSKSMRQYCPLFFRTTLRGLISPCTMPLRCSAATASATCFSRYLCGTPYNERCFRKGAPRHDTCGCSIGIEQQHSLTSLHRCALLNSLFTRWQCPTHT
eukprot:m.1559002 g.1559002  ORF g.1559002 m.1559002 type:complete len:316 (-) comp25275_c1_seq1:53-1000(-)